MEKIFFTITGTNHRYGQDFFKPDMSVDLVKEPDNEYDKEAIKVNLEGLGHVGCQQPLYSSGRKLQRRPSLRQDRRHRQGHSSLCA